MMAGAAAAIAVVARLSGWPQPPLPPPEPPMPAEAPVFVPLPAPPLPELAGAPLLPPPEPSLPLEAAPADAVDAVAVVPPVPLPDCAAGSADAASENAATLTTLTWEPFYRPETGWETYAPLIGTEIASACPPVSPGFAAALARWQKDHRLPATGQVEAATFKAMTNKWALARPFVRASQKGCPTAAPPGDLIALEKSEIYGKPEKLMPDALAAYRRMLADARATDPAIAADKRMLTVFSGYRGPDADAARCAQDNNCQGVIRTICSAHRTGLAVDLVVGAAPGMRPDSSENSNRLAMSRSPAYRWLLAHAHEYGFLPYAFEPWHWEYAGQP